MLSVAVAFRCDGTVSACIVKYMVEMLKFSCDIACACYDTNCVTDRVVEHGLFVNEAQLGSRRESLSTSMSARSGTTPLPEATP